MSKGILFIDDSIFINEKKLSMSTLINDKGQRTLYALHKLLKKENDLMEMAYQQKIKKEIEMFKRRQKEELIKSNEDNKKQIYLIQKDKNREYDMIINKYRTFKVEMMLRQKDEETRAKKMLQKAFRSGKRSMSQETRPTSNYFK